MKTAVLVAAILISKAIDTNVMNNLYPEDKILFGLVLFFCVISDAVNGLINLDRKK